MNLTDNVLSLKQQRAQLRTDLENGQRLLDRLDAAIAALDGVETNSNGHDTGPPVTDLAMSAAAKLPAVFDHAALRQKLIELFPANAEKCRKGIYPAVAQLINKGKLVRVPNGFSIAPEKTV